MLKTLALYVFIILAINCTSKKEGSLYPELSWSESNKSLAIYQLRYLEWSSWNPLMGTTNKSDFHTYLELLKWDNLKISDEPIYKVQLDYWILPPNLYYNEIKNEVIVLRGDKETGYAEPKRKISILNLTNQSTEDLYIPKMNDSIESILPSPNSNLIGFVFSNNIDDVKNYFVGIFNRTTKNMISLKIDKWSDGTESLTAWNSNSNKFYIKVNNIPYSITEESKSILKESNFPECFYPGTSYGSKFSNSGEFLEFKNPFNFKDYVVEKNEKIISFKSIKLSNIEKNCYN
jgi:hypothetical protein